MFRAFCLLAVFSTMLWKPLRAQPSRQQVDQCDTQLEDYSKAGVDAQRRALYKAEKEFSALPADPDRAVARRRFAGVVSAATGFLTVAVQ